MPTDLFCRWFDKRRDFGRGAALISYLTAVLKTTILVANYNISPFWLFVNSFSKNFLKILPKWLFCDIIIIKGMIIMDRICENIKRLRKERGLTQEQLGELIGATGTAVMRYEKGLRKLDYDKLSNIASALKVTVEELFGSDSDINKIESSENCELTIANLTNSEVNIVNSFRSLNDNGQKKAIEYIDDLSDNPKYTKK